MPSIGELTSAMESLEENAKNILSDTKLTALERRSEFARLLREYRVLEKYRTALAAFIKQMLHDQQVGTPDPEQVVQELLSSHEFQGLQLAVMAMFITTIYGGGPRSSWVPVMLLPQYEVAAPRFPV